MKYFLFTISQEQISGERNYIYYFVVASAVYCIVYTYRLGSIIGLHAVIDPSEVV